MGTTKISIDGEADRPFLRQFIEIVLGMAHFSGRFEDKRRGKSPDNDKAHKDVKVIDLPACRL